MKIESTFEDCSKISHLYKANEKFTEVEIKELEVLEKKYFLENSEKEAKVLYQKYVLTLDENAVDGVDEKFDREQLKEILQKIIKFKQQKSLFTKDLEFYNKIKQPNQINSDDRFCSGQTKNISDKNSEYVFGLKLYNSTFNSLTPTQQQTSCGDHKGYSLFYPTATEFYFIRWISIQSIINCVVPVEWNKESEHSKIRQGWYMLNKYTLENKMTRQLKGDYSIDCVELSSKEYVKIVTNDNDYDYKEFNFDYIYNCPPWLKETCDRNYKEIGIDSPGYLVQNPVTLCYTWLSEDKFNYFCKKNNGEIC